MHPYSDMLPELNNSPLSTWAFEHKRLDSYSKEIQLFILNFVFAKLAFAFGGYHHFWANDEDGNFIMEGWRSCLCGLSVRKITIGLYLILQMKTAYVERPPRNGMEFHKVCRDAHPVHDQNLALPITDRMRLLEAEIVTDDEKRRRAEVARDKCLNTVKKLLSGNFYNNIDSGQEKTRSRPISKAYEDLGYS